MKDFCRGLVNQQSEPVKTKSPPFLKGDLGGF
jgi:hypothetical protein